MTSFVDLTLGLVLAVMAPAVALAPVAAHPGIAIQTAASVSAAALAAGAPDFVFPANAIDPEWSARVAEAIAKRWNVTSAGLSLAWGTLPPQGMPAPASQFRLLGGANGWFVLSIDTGDGDVATVRVRAGSEDSVCIATRDMARGERLRDGDVTVRALARWGAPRANRDEARPAAGWELRRAIAAGSVIDSPTAQPPELVSAGDRIELWWSRGEVALALSGVALHGARLGKVVRVRVEGRPRPLIAIVDAPGRARIGSQEAS